MKALVVAEHVRGELRPITLELISAAKGLGGPVEVAVIAKDPSAFTDAVNVEGVDEILAVAVDQGEFENDVYQAAVEQLVAERSPRAVLLGFTVNSMGYGPALAAKLGLGLRLRRPRGTRRGRRDRRRALLLRRQGERRGRVPGP